MDEAQLMNPCISFYTSSQAFKIQPAFVVMLFPTFFKSWEHFKILQQWNVVLKEKKSSCNSHSSSM